jgi:hypothetical protein
METHAVNSPHFAFGVADTGQPPCEGTSVTALALKGSTSARHFRPCGVLTIRSNEAAAAKSVRDSELLLATADRHGAAGVLSRPRPRALPDRRRARRQGSRAQPAGAARAPRSRGASAAGEPRAPRGSARTTLPLAFPRRRRRERKPILPARRDAQGGAPCAIPAPGSAVATAPLASFAQVHLRLSLTHSPTSSKSTRSAAPTAQDRFVPSRRS